MDTSKLRAAVIAKQELILNRLALLSYEEVMQLMASLYVHKTRITTEVLASAATQNQPLVVTPKHATL